MNVKKGFCRIFVLFLCVLLVGFPQRTTAAEQTFTDVDQDAWYASAVEYVHEKDWMNGVGNNRFAPK